MYRRPVKKTLSQITRRQLSGLLEARRGELDVKLLLYAIQKTGAFEQLLEQRFQLDTGTPPLPPYSLLLLQCEILSLC